jgi:hypothetical protein
MILFAEIFFPSVFYLLASIWTASRLHWIWWVNAKPWVNNQNRRVRGLFGGQADEERWCIATCLLIGLVWEVWIPFYFLAQAVTFHPLHKISKPERERRRQTRLAAVRQEIKVLQQSLDLPADE